MTRLILYIISIVTCFSACGRHSASKQNINSESSIMNKPNLKISFNEDSAFNYVKRQVDFGPRVPGTKEHLKAGDWLISQLAEYCDTVIVQTDEMKAFNGVQLPVRNIFGRINPEIKDRLLLVAHYDSRPWADQESDKNKINQPIPGANDGASGVGVIMELARVISENDINKGIDILLTDVEDYGSPEGNNFLVGDSEDSWCLGTQLWTQKLPYTMQELPKFAILLDMVGGYDAKFHREYFSDQLAGRYVDLVWSTASKVGHGDRFINEPGGAITDDHIYLIKAGIPAIDIIENKNEQTGSFNPTWHTLADDMGNIDRRTLKAVGETVQDVIINF